MWNNALTRFVGAFAGWDIDYDEEPAAGDDSSSEVDPPEAAPKKEKPVPPLHLLQIERAWLEFASVCDGVHDLAHFDIEHDVRLDRPIRIAILDTGVYQEHDALVGRVARVRNFVSRTMQPDAVQDLMRDRNGHGTFCAALAVGGAYRATPKDGGEDEPLFHNGVAPFAKVVVGKILDNELRSNIEWLIKGLKWACDLDRDDNRRPVNADIISISVGMPRYHPELRKVLYQALQKGKIVVCCASNEEEENAYNIQYPARLGDVICVGSQSENGQATGFTPAGREIDVLGPGENVWSACSQSHNTVRARSGTFIAAPYIAGVCALILAYAEKLGGQDVRRIVSNTHVMKELLKRMSSMPGHHDPSAGYGNVTPFRLFKYGPQTFLREVYAILGDQSTEEFQVAHPTGPLQPVIYNFNAASVAAWIPRDKDAMRGLIRSLVKEKATLDWYSMVESLLFGTDVDCSSCALQGDGVSGSTIVEVTYSKVMDLVDLSLSEDVFEKLSAAGFQGLNLDNVLGTYFASFEGTVKKLVLPDFAHVAHCGPLTTLRHVYAQLVRLPGTTPLQYVMDMVKILAEGGSNDDDEEDVALLVEKLDFEMHSMVHPKSVARCADHLEFLLAGCCPDNLRVFIQDVDGLQNEDSSHLIGAIKELSSAAFRQLLEEGDIEGEAAAPAIFYSADELPEDLLNGDSLPESGRAEIPANQDPTGTLKTFSLASEIESFLSSQERQTLARGFPNKTQVVMKAALKGYEGALHVLLSSSLGDSVSCLDLRMDELKLSLPEVDVSPIGGPKGMLLTMPEHMHVSSNVTFEDTRVASLSGIFRALSIKSAPSCEIHEVVLPPLDHLDDIVETFRPNVWRKCREVYLTGTTRLAQLILILRSLPKGEYPLNIHVPHLKMYSSLAGESSRDFDSPSCVNVTIYDFDLDCSFFSMPKSTVKTIYEICLKLSSVAMLKNLKGHCQMFLDSPTKFQIPYNSVRCYEGCQTLQAYLDDAIEEEIVSDDESMLSFAENIYKYQVMASSVGRQRFRRAFKPISPQDDASSYTLPTNRYKQVLTETGSIASALKEDKIGNVTVAIFGMGVNALHPEFFTKLAHVRKSGRERGCPFGDSIIGLAFSVTPEETMSTFLDEDATVGTIAAALIAGTNCGAAPFANIVSVKVGTASGSVKPKWVIEGIQWLLEQESQGTLPPSDIVLFPFTFGHFNHRLYLLVNQLCSAGKVVVCAAGKSSPVDEHRMAYPAFYGDVLCVGSHGTNGETSSTSGKGRDIDLTAFGEVTSQHHVIVPDKWYTAVAAAQVVGVVAYTLAYSEIVGGPSLRQAISNNSVMREILRQMCTKPGQHDERSGHGCLTPNQVFKHGEDYFKKVVSEITEEYFEISVRRRVRTWSVAPLPKPSYGRSVSVQDLPVAPAPRSRTLSFSGATPRPRPSRRARTYSGTFVGPKPSDNLQRSHHDPVDL